MIIFIFHNDYLYFSQWLLVFSQFWGLSRKFGQLCTAADHFLSPRKIKHSKQQVQKKFVCRSKCWFWCWWQDWCCWWSDTIPTRAFPILAGFVKSIHRVHKVFTKRRQVGGNKCWVSTACFASCVRGHRVRQVVVWGLVRQVADRWFVAWSDRWLASRTDRWLMGGCSGRLQKNDWLLGH